MREILYQGKETGSSKWVQGDLVTNGIDYIAAIRINDKTSSEYGQIVRVDPETVREFTGVWEKNGKKSKRIFEGDIVLAVYRNGRGRKADKYIGVVHFGEFQDCVGSKYTGFYIKWKHYVRRSLLWWRDSSNTSLEVIGNKWDNPELLEG